MSVIKLIVRKNGAAPVKPVVTMGAEKLSNVQDEIDTIFKAGEVSRV